METPMTHNETTSFLEERLRGMVRRLMGDKVAGRAIVRDESLVDIGMTSLDVVKLMLALEGELELTIPESELTPANFRSLASIETMLERIGATRS
jgi:acyl carrier protein